MHEAALAVGMILQRFKLIDVNRYQLALKETLTIKPDGFRIKVRPRDEKDRGAFAGAAAGAAASGAAAPRARTRPGHNTPLLVLYGSNLGTAEELATRVADLAEVNGFATRLAPLDEFAGKLPDEGGVLIFCASYNGAPPDNATDFVKWLRGDLPMDAFAKVRYAVFGCGNSDWTATYQSIPRLIDERLTAHGARGVYARGEGDARGDLDSQFETWFASLAPAAVKAFGLDATFSRSADDEPLYRIEPVAPTTVSVISLLGGATPMKVLVNSELQNKTGTNASDRSTRHVEVQLPSGIGYRVGDHLSVVPRNDPALVDSVARRFGFLPADLVRLQVAEGRRAQLPAGEAISVGRLLTEFVELQQVATRKQIQIMSEHTRRALSHRDFRQTQICVRPPGGISGLRIAVPRLSRNALAARAALLLDLLVAFRRCRALQHHGRRRRRRSTFGARHLQGRLLELSRGPPGRRHHPRHGARDQGGLPPAG
jgi:cytochrome P450/NADPH-cytochrome P450 reductase